MNSITEARINELLDAWNHHEDLRRAGASVSELVESRDHLDSARAAVH